MTESKICTCPSGDGSLRWPCPKHPAVEQAGGDERAAFEAYRDRRNALLESEGHKPGSKWHVTNAHYPTWEASRAALAQPYPAQAEAERPEVVARVVHSNPIVLGQCGPLNANDELMTVAQHAASVARWAEMFNRVEQERDVALARVAELERQEPVDVPGPDEIHQMAFEEGQPAEDGDGYLFSAEEFDLFVQRLLDSCATPVAWAQHSVPEGWMLVECGIWTQEQVDEMQKTVTRFRNSEFVDDRALAMAVADAGQCKAPEISLAELLAAAPVCRLSRSALTDAQMRRLYDSSTETENERLGFAAFARLIRRAEAVHQIAAAPGKEGV
ncbi:hypothetical protein ACIUX8_06150 [Pseudomonas aeruginosa]|nr:hypothetical protein [Pseudomonas aeruginosa]